jgi:hypothetical protein
MVFLFFAAMGSKTKHTGLRDSVREKRGRSPLRAKAGQTPPPPIPPPFRMLCKLDIANLLDIFFSLLLPSLRNASSSRRSTSRGRRSSPERGGSDFDSDDSSVVDSGEDSGDSSLDGDPRKVVQCICDCEWQCVNVLQSAVHNIYYARRNSTHYNDFNDTPRHATVFFLSLRPSIFSDTSRCLVHCHTLACCPVLQFLPSFRLVLSRIGLRPPPPLPTLTHCWFRNIMTRGNLRAKMPRETTRFGMRPCMTTASATNSERRSVPRSLSLSLSSRHSDI